MAKRRANAARRKPAGKRSPRRRAPARRTGVRKRSKRSKRAKSTKRAKPAKRPAARQPKRKGRGRKRVRDRARAPRGRGAVADRAPIPTEAQFRKLPLSRTFRQFVRPVGRGRGMVYAVVKTAWVYAGRATKPRVIPLQLGRMTGAQARALTEVEILEQVELGLVGVDIEDVELLGLIQGKPDRERKGLRIRRARGRGSKTDRGAGRKRLRRGR